MSGGGVGGLGSGGVVRVSVPAGVNGEAGTMPIENAVGISLDQNQAKLENLLFQVTLNAWIAQRKDLKIISTRYFFSL